MRLAFASGEDLKRRDGIVAAVARRYWQKNINGARMTMKVLAELQRTAGQHNKMCA
ncbi:MAG TPA: hypothetical protein VN611_15655 [Patescibacteria group bacterium]|nr:hypothetical protein [Patescibacteria group bacterium]